MGLFGPKQTEEEFRHEEIGRFLLDNEVIIHEIGNIDKSFITNKRVIFKDVSFTLNSDLLEMVFIPFSKIDGVSYVERNKSVINRVVRIKTRGFSHDMGFMKAQEDECVDFCKKLGQIMLDNNN